jgi:Glycosyltransferase family 20
LGQLVVVSNRVAIPAQLMNLKRRCSSILYDPDSVAAAIGQALSMPLAERRERHDALFQVLSHNDIQHWADRFLTALEREPKPLSQLEEMPSMG